MGHRAGWLTLGAGLAGGADVILIPEIPYDVEKIAEAIGQRSKRGSNFSIVAVAEGAMSRDDARVFDGAEKKLERAKSLNDKIEAKHAIAALEVRHQDNTLRLAHQLEGLTHLESRVTILGHVQRGGTPCAADRILATRLGTACADLIAKEQFGVMVAARGENAVPVPSIRSQASASPFHATIHGSMPPAAWGRAWGIRGEYFKELYVPQARKPSKPMRKCANRLSNVFGSGVCRMIKSSIPLRSKGIHRLRIFASIMSRIGIR